MPIVINPEGWEILFTQVVGYEVNVTGQTCEILQCQWVNLAHYLKLSSQYEETRGLSERLEYCALLVEHERLSQALKYLQSQSDSVSLALPALTKSQASKASN